MSSFESSVVAPNVSEVSWTVEFDQIYGGVAGVVIDYHSVSRHSAERMVQLGVCAILPYEVFHAHYPVNYNVCFCVKTQRGGICSEVYREVAAYMKPVSGFGDDAENAV